MGIGERLKEERERLGYIQTDFAALAGASKNSQYNYEKGERCPDAAYLAAVAAVGVDVLYVVTGTRTPLPSSSLTPEEGLVLEQYRSLPDQDRAAVSRLTSALSLTKSSPQ
ncbi:helix-turn-helix transcriptional regulator [Pseudomonas sp. PDM18]|uniref:helix-turn-helix domain-containing protein n=1 Tax=Pseudomonas sp. PDM18 TaxID=2769253 RepID=UPI00177EEDFE|nr:helix-turn-helix transcriptional regulator [Pseudomonas sp. PDM18]MBD9676260.1 helix-turn-helix transcriptional regulator [Pseudomonas sp. PDM18]